MPINKTLNPSEQEKPITPNNEIEDIFEHEEKGKLNETPENIPEQPIPEQKIEKPVETESTPEAVETKSEEAETEDEMNQMKAAPQQDQTQQIPPPQQKSMELIKIENILSENLDELFLNMTPQQQMAFKQKGEETATKIDELLKETKVKIKEIITLIKEWLQIIPGINKFFLEQEAKIKTDRLLNIKEQKK